MRTLTSALLATYFVAFIGCAQGVPPDELFGPSPGEEDSGAPGSNDPFDPADPTGSPEAPGTGGSTGDFGGSGGAGLGGSGGANLGGSGGANLGGSGGANLGGSGGAGLGGSGGASFGGSGGSSTGGSGGSTVPGSWNCTASFYGDGSCDCGCLVADPDCYGAGCTDASCSAAACEYCHDASGTSISCSGTSGTGGGGSGWTCDPTYYGDYSCDCGCGIPDTDCGFGGCEAPGCYDSYCDYCFDANGGEVTCGSGTGTGTGGCSDTCLYANDGFCDDGGTGSSFSVCDLGTDCTDCGPR